MNLRLLVVTLLLLFVGLTALLALQYRLQRSVGEVASPQQAVVQLGDRQLVAGGRAGVELAARRGEKAELIVRCGAGERWVKLAVGETSDEICAVRVKLTGFSTETGTLATSRAHIEVSWQSPEAGAREESN